MRSLPAQIAGALVLVGACLWCERAPAQDEESAPTPVPSLDRARDAFQDAIERIWIPQSRLTDGPQVRAAFRDVVADVSQGVVQVRCNGKTAALGGIVGADGWVLTKATQLDGAVKVRLKDDREFDAQVTGIDRKYDLAMLKIDAKELPVLQLTQNVNTLDGDWVATVGTGRDPVAVGVLSVSPRKIPHLAGILGVRLEEAQGGAMVIDVFSDSGAAQAGILINDLIMSINGKPTGAVLELQQAIQRFSPGDQITVGVRRGGKDLVLKAMLSGRVKELGPSRSDYQNNLGSQLSKRRFGFPSAMQHDTVLSATQCGGPLVNLDGEVIGFNIARAGRTESYAVPMKVVHALLFDLMSGKLAPPKDNS